jgi:GTPase SAR1 family protein
MLWCYDICVFLFIHLCCSHYKRAVGALIVYDITKPSSFENIKKWMASLKTHAGEDIVIMLVGISFLFFSYSNFIGNKLDLCESNANCRKVAFEDASCFAQKNKLLFHETSAFTNINIKDTFETLVEGM